MLHTVSVSGDRLIVRNTDNRFMTTIPYPVDLRYDRLFWQLWIRDHIKQLLFLLPIGNAPDGEMQFCECDQTDLLSDDRILRFFNHIKPQVCVLTALDQVTFHGFVKLGVDERLPITPNDFKSLRDVERKRRPTSRKAVLADWQYQS